MTPGSDEAVLRDLKRAFSAVIPTGSVIAARAIARAIAGHENDAAWIKGNFSQLVEEIQIAAYHEYVDAERSAGEAAIIRVFTPLVSVDTTAADTLRAVANRFVALDRFYLGLTQGRRPRAGKAFELLIREFFVRSGYPFTAQAAIDGQPDFCDPVSRALPKQSDGLRCFHGQTHAAGAMATNSHGGGTRLGILPRNHRRRNRRERSTGDIGLAHHSRGA
jgi:hypothetical protein